MSKQIKNVKGIQSKAKKNIVAHVSGNLYKVTSATSGNEYAVRTNGDCGVCNCTWSQYRPAGDKRSACSHVVAALDFIAEEKGRTVSAWSSTEQAERQHRPAVYIGDGVTLTSRLVS